MTEVGHIRLKEKEALLWPGWAICDGEEHTFTIKGYKKRMRAPDLSSIATEYQEYIIKLEG